MVGRREQQAAVPQDAVDLEHDLPRHREVLEGRDRVDGVERPLDELREPVRVADDVDVRARMDVDADVAPVAVQARVDLRPTGTELQHAVVVERVRGLHEVGEDRVERIIRTIATERATCEPDQVRSVRPGAGAGTPA